MGTRSLTYVYDGEEKEENILVCLYRQFDGYPTGHGKDLLNYFGKTKIINGFNEHKAPEYANGMACFAAQLVAHFKEGIGQIYLMQPKLNQDCWQDYEYHLSLVDDEIALRIQRFDGNTIWAGSLKDFNPKTAENEEDD